MAQEPRLSPQQAQGERSNLLICPKCKKLLIPDLESYTCAACGVHWPIQAGVIKAPNFDENQYWGEIPRIRMEHILWRAKTIGAAMAMAEWGHDTGNTYVERYAMDSRRSLGLETVGLAHNARVLDYGCGYGTLGLTTTERSSVVFLVDSTLERIQFAQLRALELGAENVVAIALQDWKTLPIPNGSLDLIILNGVLEWIPTTREGDPVDVQMEFLVDMRDLLRPGGVIYLAIENRYALRYITGYPDDHSELRFTSIMPRRFADLYSRMRRRSSYRTITWSLGEHRERLGRLGLPDPVVYCLQPDYRFPQAACRIDDPTALAHIHNGTVRARGLKAKLKRAVELLITTVGLRPWLVYSFGIVARRPMEDKEA